jgi:pimeloyl-ACP methyl ester carboxylesterase
MQSGKVTCGDAVIHYVREGRGPDIVWIPGGDQRGVDWAEQFAAFKADFRNTSYDPRGVGETSSATPPPWSIATFAGDCAELVRAVCTPPVFLVGLSMGALIVQEMALSHPELIRAAIAMGTAGRKSGFLREWEEAEIALRRRGDNLPRDFAVIHYALLMYPAEVLGDDALWAKVRPVVAAAYEERDGAMLAAQWQACLDYDSLDRLPDCRVPLHVVAFSQDLQCPPARGRLVAAAAPKGRFHLLEGLGHVSLIGHRPDAVNECIRGIIAEHL